MKPGIPSSPWYIRTGDDFEYFFRIRDAVTGVYRDLTGWTGRAQLRATKDAESPLASFDVTITPEGVLLSLDDTATSTIPPTPPGATTIFSGLYVADVELTDTRPFTRTWLEAPVQVEKDVTR